MQLRRAPSRRTLPKGAAFAALAFAALLISALVGISARVDADDKWRLALDTLVYADGDDVTVVTPQTSVRYLLDEDGGEVRARVGVDVVSAASVDVIAQATRGFREVRTDATLGVSKAFGDWLPSFDYHLSTESDYLSNGGRLGLRARLGSPDTVLQLGYGFSSDLVGRRESFDQQHESVRTHRADVSLTQALGPRTLLRGAVTLTARSGFQSKPYRFVPLFDQAALDRARADGVELDRSSFAAYAINRVPERVPDERVGVAMAGRLLHYVRALRGSLRLDYQVYLDSWGLVANTLEPAVTLGLSREWSLVAYGRVYLQGNASFWRRTYVVQSAAPSPTIPTYRSLDRELSKFQTYTLGARVEWTAPDARFAFFVDGAVAYSHYEQFLYLEERVAFIGLAGVRWTP